jgi:alkaline phosphatase D
MARTCIAGIVVAALSLSASAANQRTKSSKGSRGSLETALGYLDGFGKAPAASKEIYSAAYRLLDDKDATCAVLANDTAFQDLCRKHGLTHLGGPMLGSLTSDGARVWIRTLKPASVEVRVQTGNGEKRYGPVRSTLESDLVAIVPVSGLAAGTTNPYSVWIDGDPVSIPAHAAIVTAPEPVPTGKTRIAFGSCFHRWGLANPKQAELIRSRDPAAMLLIGDIAVQDRNNHLGMHRADYVLREFHPAWRDLVARIPVYATWDDHDYFRNDGAGIPKGYTLQDKQNVCDIFAQSWANPTFGFDDERRGVFTRTRIGPCDIIMVDNRYFRDSAKHYFLGPDQLKWVKESLLACKGPFIIMSCGTMWSDFVSNGKDSFGKHGREEREEIFSLIEKNRIGGVLLISGDRHGARGFTIPRPSGFSFYEFEPGSLGGRTGPAAKSPSWKTQLFGISGKYAFGEFTFDADKPDPEVTFRLIQDDGTEIYKLTVRRSQLTPGT